MHNENTRKRCCRGTVEHDKKINVWGCFCTSGVGNIMRIEGTLVKETYLDILDDHMLPSADMLLGRDNWHFNKEMIPNTLLILFVDGLSTMLYLYCNGGQCNPLT
jgi:hypothetical protein